MRRVNAGQSGGGRPRPKRVFLSAPAEPIAMERLRAAVAGLAVVAAVFGGLVAIRVVTRFLRAAVWFAETAATLAFALLLGYLAYRVLWGESDDPRRH
jgi:hypothetical protein